MIARLELWDPDAGNASLDVALHPSYGEDLPITRQILSLALLVAEWPVLLDEAGGLLRLPPGSVRDFTLLGDEAEGCAG